MRLQVSSVAVCLLLMAGVASAETIVCESIGAGKIKRVVATRNPYDHEPQWFDVVVKRKNPLLKDREFDLEPLYLSGDKMLLIDPDGSPRAARVLMSFNGVSALGKNAITAELTFDKGSTGELTQLMSCRADRPVPVIDYCSTSEYGTPIEALFYASKVRNANLVEMLLSCKLNVNTKDAKGCSALMYAVDAKCGTGDVDELDFAPSRDIIDSLISAGAFVDIIDPVTLETPLVKSARFLDYDAIKSFADMEADINAQDREGFTALMNAVKRDDPRLVELLLHYNPDLGMANNAGETAAMIASANGFLDVEILLQTPSKTLTFVGNEAGGCSLNETVIDINKVALIELKASREKMSLLKIPELGVSLMADPGETKSFRLRSDRAGSYGYVCGAHGGNSFSKGAITVR